jgi:hypothetical protein
MIRDRKGFRVALLLSVALTLSTGVLATHAASGWRSSRAANSAATKAHVQPAAAGTTVFLPLITQLIPPLRIDTGASASYADSSGNIWQPDSGFIGGQAGNLGNISIANTNDPQIYRTERFNLTGYAFGVANGNYSVRLHFAENFYTAAGRRIISVSVEGTPINTIDVFAEAGGGRTALIKTANVTVSDNQLNLSFTASVGETMIDGIEIIPQ